MAVFKCQEFQYGTETAFAENGSAPASLSYSKRIPAEVTVKLDEPRVDNTAAQSRQNMSRAGYRGCRSGSIAIKTPFAGHGGTCAGALTKTWLQELLSDGLGGNSVAATGTTIKTAGTVSSLVCNASTGWAVGMIGRAGAIGDAKGNGQPFVVGALPGSDTLTLLTALDAAPGVGDVVYAMQQAYPLETLSANSKRFLVAHVEAGLQYHVLGCHLGGAELTFEEGALPYLTLTYQCAFWERYSVTTPSAVAMEAAECAPVAAGSLFMNAVGTLTRATYQPWSVSLALDLGLVANKTPGALTDRQAITNFARTKCIPTVTMIGPWSSVLEDLGDLDGGSAVYEHILFSTCPDDGKAVAWYMPSAYVVGAKPTAIEHNEQTAITTVLRGREGPNITTDLTRSAIRFGVG